MKTISCIWIICFFSFNAQSQDDSVLRNLLNGESVRINENLVAYSHFQKIIVNGNQKDMSHKPNINNPHYIIISSGKNGTGRCTISNSKEGEIKLNFTEIRKREAQDFYQYELIVVNQDRIKVYLYKFKNGNNPVFSIEIDDNNRKISHDYVVSRL